MSVGGGIRSCTCENMWPVNFVKIEELSSLLIELTYNCALIEMAFSSHLLSVPGPSGSSGRVRKRGKGNRLPGKAGYGSSMHVF